MNWSVKYKFLTILIFLTFMINCSDRSFVRFTFEDGEINISGNKISYKFQESLSKDDSEEYLFGSPFQIFITLEASERFHNFDTTGSVKFIKIELLEGESSIILYPNSEIKNLLTRSKEGNKIQIWLQSVHLSNGEKTIRVTYSIPGENNGIENVVLIDLKPMVVKEKVKFIDIIKNIT